MQGAKGRDISGSKAGSLHVLMHITRCILDAALEYPGVWPVTPVLVSTITDEEVMAAEFARLFQFKSVPQTTQARHCM